MKTNGAKGLKKYRTRSVRFRLTAYFIIFALALMGMLWLFQTMFLEQYYEREMEKKIQTAVSSLSLQYAISEDLDLEAYLQEIGDISSANDMYFYIEAEDESFNISSTDQGSAGRYYYGRSGVDLARERLIANNGEPVTFKITNQTGETVTQVYAAKVDSEFRPNVRFFAFAPLTPMGPAVGILAKQLLTVTAISLVVAGILALYISSRIARPIKNITEKASELAEGNYDVEFEGSSYREINNLAGTLNATAEALSKTEQLQRDLMANVSHDLRTPITMVKSYAEMIRDISGGNEEKRNEHLGVIIEESDRLSYLVNDILTLSRIQAGVETMDLQPVDLQKCAESIVATYRVLEEQEGFSIRLSTLPQTLLVNADQHRMEQVLSNLLSNAVRYSGDVKDVEVAFLQDKKWLRCEVRDKGIGIAEEDLPNIWNRYERASTRGARSKQGTGLGLSITKEILDRHGAKYGVESKVGEGSTFWFALPLID
ncbi:MAG: HAMP domain-containing histidine kinase [Firmicutes bacterium]|nr:HAMP domain-containing histidine kinase [Bacillota bacterium]